MKKYLRKLIQAIAANFSSTQLGGIVIEATEEAIRFLLGKPLLSPVPKEEYELQRQSQTENRTR